MRHWLFGLRLCRIPPCHNRSVRCFFGAICGVRPIGRLTPRSRRGPTANHQARLQVRFIILPPGLALCRRSRLNSNVRPHNSYPTVSVTLFETERIRCRHWLPEDFDALFSVYSDPEAMRWVGKGEPITRSACKAWFKVTEANYIKRGYGMFALESRAHGTVIGFCGLVHPGGQSEPEVKYAFLKPHWGKGLASESIPALLQYGARAHGLSRIIATVAPANLASQRVLCKAGMHLLRQRENEDGSLTCVYEWQAPSEA